MQVTKCNTNTMAHASDEHEVTNPQINSMMKSLKLPPKHLKFYSKNKRVSVLSHYIIQYMLRQSISYTHQQFPQSIIAMIVTYRVQIVRTFPLNTKKKLGPLLN